MSFNSIFLCSFIVGLCIGAAVPRVWMCLVTAECLSILVLAFVYGVVLPRELLSLSSFLQVMLISRLHPAAFGVMAFATLAGHLARRAFRRAKAPRNSI